MKTALTIIMAMTSLLSAYAFRFSYDFDNIPLPDALTIICKDHPELSISFIYKDLDNYTTSAAVRADRAYDAIRQITGLNPVSVIQKHNEIYVEALQHGRFCFSGNTADTDGEPLPAVTIMLLTPSDSTVITYGISDVNGRFNIPCDTKDVILKASHPGYKTVFRRPAGFETGIIVMHQLPIALHAVNVNADYASVYNDRTVYTPTNRQKNASQNGTELLSRMAIPQLKIAMGESIETNGGQPVAVFIDFVPATANDLKAMRTTDVRRVEYYDYPSDPRLSGNAHAVNFIMAKYEYGGYVKGFGLANLISFSEQLLGNIRMQYKKMTYDIMGSGFNFNSDRYGSTRTETFRLPQNDGTTEIFDRTAGTTSSKEERQQYFAAFRAAYNSDMIQATSLLSGSIDRRPHSDRYGLVSYSNSYLPPSEYASTFDNRSKFLSYNGYYFLKLPEDNTLTFTPSYSYSHTRQQSVYTETGTEALENGAVDNTNFLSATLKYTHNFGSGSSLTAFVRGSYEYNRTRYTGTISATDRARSSRAGTGVTYTMSLGKFYGLAGFGWDWDDLKFDGTSGSSSAPWFDLSLQYGFSRKQSISGTFHYSTWAPSPNFKSNNVIRITPLMSHTGNPTLRPYKSYDIGVNYNWFPHSDYNLGTFAWAWIVGNRYAYDYEASPDGILRTIKQPIGSFASGKYGINGTVRLFDRNLVLTAQIAQYLSHNGAPYNTNHTFIEYYAQAQYYIGKWNFSLTYISANAVSEDYINGFYKRQKDNWTMNVGWSDGLWNIKAGFINMTRWNWQSDRRDMSSSFYSSSERLYNDTNHALIQLSATYTFGFGRKVERNNEPSVSGSASSGILK